MEHEAISVDAVVVGAGFAGLYMLHKLRGLDITVIGIEAGGDVGGTWYWNRYPGARCDIESLAYSFSFSEELVSGWDWSERFSAQPEILRYIGYVADRLNLRCDIRFNTKVTAAHWNEESGRWEVSLDDGSAIDARFCIMATGCLSQGRLPDIPGIDSFMGESYHTGAWPHEPVSLAGKRVGVIGTGSSGIQVVPAVAPEASHLTVFQRTPSFSVPARNRPLDPDFAAKFRRERATFLAGMRAGEIFGSGDLEQSAEERQYVAAAAAGLDAKERDRIYDAQWRRGGSKFMVCFPDQMVNADSNAAASDFVRARIAETVKDPKIAETLTPRGYPLGSKRICLDTNYYETFNRENVTLVDTLKHPIVAVEPGGIRTTNATYPLDAIIYATGYDAMTGSIARVDFVGRDGERLVDRWAAGPTTYLGLAVSGFPNLFLITGPGSPSVISNVVAAIEQHVEWVADCLAHMREKGLATIQAEPEAEQDWVNHVNEVADATLFPVANSWYVGANVPGKPRVFMAYVGGIPAFRAICDEIAADGYRGFAFDGEHHSTTERARVAALGG